MEAYQEVINDIIKAAGGVSKEVETCPVCGKPKQIRREVFGELRLLPVMCACEIEAERIRKENIRIQKLADARRRCFSGDYSRLSGASLADAYLEHPKEAKIVQRYINNFGDFYRNQQGLLLHGPNGTGKSFLAAALCNALIEKEHDVYYTTFTQIDRHTAGARSERQAFFDSLNEYALLVLDDLGAERGSEYMQELVFSVIDSRYSSGKPLVITTNLTMQDLKNPQTAQQSRIYDRILQICYPVQMTGESIRRKDTKERFYKAKTILEG